MRKYPFYPFLPAIFFALPPAIFIVGWFAGDADPLQPIGGKFLALVAPFVFIGLFGLMFRRIWGLWLYLALWAICVLFNFYGYFCDVYEEKTYFPRYFWLFRDIFYYFSACICSCGLGLWLCHRLKRKKVINKNEETVDSVLPMG